MTTAKNIRLHILEEITNGFSVDSRIGRGGYGDVYKGVYNSEMIAVKLLHDDPEQVLDDRQFHSEVGNLLRVEHPNIVRLCGYCYEAQYKYVEHEGKDRLCKHMYRVLCFEYMHGGSLDKHLHAQSFAPNWSTCYNIIKGICEGLNFLHGCEPPIFHLDLKPANILLDSSMVPKVADFGLSRLFGRSHTHVTERIIGTHKYMPPEFIKQGIISPKNDVFSLGVVIIEIMTGPTGYSNFLEMGHVAQFVQEVLTNWKNMIEATSEYPSEELHQVQTCIDTAMSCVEPDRNSRPTIADILDILNKTETHIPKRQVADVLPCRALGPKNTLAKRLNTMTTEVDNITNKHQHFSCMPRDSLNINVQQVPGRETSSDVEETLIIGRNEEKQKILSILSESITKEMVVLPIYGIGGIGKTTLAQLLFNDTQFQGYSRVWVYVPQEFNLNKIGNSIISQLTNKTSNISDKQMLHKRLQELFAGNNILIVLDDLWEEKQQELDTLKAMLRLGRGSKVIVVTTRDEAIARKMCSIVMPYKLETLTDDMCWTILQQKSDYENRPDKDLLKQIGKEISIKCGGVALAAQSLGYMLRDMTSDQWQSVRDNDIWKISSDQEVLASLRLSYSHMPKWLQLCFSYCAVFPKGHNIVKHDLIHQWIALGFAEPSGIFDSLQLCEKYVTQLLGMSFLEYSKAPSSHGRREKSVTLFTMHDLVHDLARAMLADKVNEKDNAVGSSCHYALLTDCSKPLQLSVSSPENTRFKIFCNPFQKKSSSENIKALFFLDCGDVVLRGGAFSAAKCLHVLDLSECLIQKLPGSIGRLKQLRYLHAPRIRNRMIPDCITELSELNYLNLRRSENISALPKSIGDMKGLIHLDLSGCTAIDELPLSFAELKQLVHLDLSYCCMSISKAFGGFTKLQYLNLSLKEFQCIVVGSRRGLVEVIGNLIKLRYLNLSGCMYVMAQSRDRICSLFGYISTLSNLEHLDLSRNEELLSIPESIGNLRKLHTLDLSGCKNLKKLPDSMVMMVSLKILNVEGCCRLDKSELSRLNFAWLPHFVVHASSDRCSSNIILLQPTNPDVLEIDRLENVKSAAEAHSIKLIGKQEIEVLKFQWTLGAGRFVDDKEVLEKLVPPSSVRDFSITGYRSVSIPDWLMDIRQYLPNLLKLNLWNFPKCNKLPPLGQLPNLQGLSLSHMEDLEDWNMAYTSGEEGANEVIFPKLEMFIKHCAKLRIKPCLPRAVSILTIIDCDNVLVSLGESLSHSGASSSPTTRLTVSSKVPMHQWRLLHHLPALRKLTINGCSDLTTSPEVIQRLSSLKSLSLKLLSVDQAELPSWLVELTSLQELSLSECGSMTSVPEWLGDFTSLKKIRIKYCEGIMSLPDSIQQLTKLESLKIRGCRLLEKWCVSEEKMKLAHIREVHVPTKQYVLIYG